ncbi:MAG: helix-turn-helix domain-containing protein [Solirubrobacterales bacterium]|nr:helix-turn-helix domain-containing protein [Solirubrobacterales bacterium]
MEPKHLHRHVLTVEQAAALLQLSPDTLYTMLRRGEVPGKKLGSQWRIPRAPFMDWLHAGWTPSEPPPAPEPADSYPTWPR